MEFFISYDADWEARLNKVLGSIRETGYRDYFSEQKYGSSLDGIAVILMCQDPELNLKQRVQFSKKQKTLYLDIMLDLDQFLVIEQKEKEKIVVGKLISEIPPIVAKYKLSDFDLVRFEKDLKVWMLKALQ